MLPNATPPTSSAMTNPVLNITNLSKHFETARGEVRAVDDVSLQLVPKDFVALHGPSGCGKSTLLLTAGGLLSPDGGTVEIASENPYALGPDAHATFRARYIGFVFQQLHLIPFLDVLDNVLVGQLAGDNRNGTSNEPALELLGSFGLADRLHHVPSTLSIGEQQRVALARALLHRPALLLADEPTGNLDAANAEIILDQLRAFTDKGGAVLMVTHDDKARAAATRSIALDAGRLTPQ